MSTAIRALVEKVYSHGLAMEVIESVNMHEDIKLGRETRDVLIENHIETIRNLAAFGVRVIVYHFMPVFDWLRTDLNRLIPEDASYSMYFDEKDIANMGPLDIVRSKSRRLRSKPFGIQAASKNPSVL